MATVNKKMMTIVGDSHLKFLNTEKMSNSHHTVNKDFKPGIKIREALQKTGKMIVTSPLYTHQQTTSLNKPGRIEQGNIGNARQDPGK